MTEEPNLREVEKRTYMAYHQDGLVDIFAGIYVFGFAAGILMNELWDFSFGVIMPGILIALLLPLWIIVKRKVTMPRIGFVKFGASNPNKLMGLLIGLMVFGVLIVFLFLFASTSRDSFLLSIIRDYGILIIGAAVFAVSSLFGYVMGLSRLYFYGGLTFAMFLFAFVFGVFFAYILVALSLVLICSGGYLLAKFIKKYPIKGDRPLED